MGTQNNLWLEKKDHRAMFFLYNRFIENAGFYNDNSSRVRTRETVSASPKKIISVLTDFVYCVVDDRAEREDLIDALRSFDINYNSDDLNTSIKVKNLMLEVFYQSCLGDNDFAWISNSDDRLVNFIWASILLIKDKKQFFDGVFQSISIDKAEPRSELYDAYADDPLYSSLYLDNHPASNLGKILNITLFFDLCCFELMEKTSLMNILKSRWSGIKNSSKVINWLSKNECLWGWAWDYAFSRYLNSKEPLWLELNSTESHEMVKSKKMALITFYDLLKLEHQLLVISELKKSGAQQKYRMKLQGEDAPRKMVQISMSVSTKDKLKKLADREHQKMNYIVEMLINERYLQLYGDNN
ncbi:hypothetical protein [Plesiomonas shigelloides]|uniref:hypothetical protein n=1 Tax=Plesiomonas shigelloides TaxID=703 RepID=UPI002247214C|nr:hypothetical protein [Plesiomonas shigelloides]MCX2499410.1 hypothetical protein [Plesiomonas shigelloides]